MRVGFDVEGRLPEARKRYSVETTRTFTCGTGKFGARYGAKTPKETRRAIFSRAESYPDVPAGRWSTRAVMPKSSAQQAAVDDGLAGNHGELERRLLARRRVLDQDLDVLCCPRPTSW